MANNKFKKEYELLDDLWFYEEVEPKKKGEIRSDIPLTSVPWLLRDGLIREHKPEGEQTNAAAG